VPLTSAGPSENALNHLNSALFAVEFALLQTVTFQGLLDCVQRTDVKLCGPPQLPQVLRRRSHCRGPIGNPILARLRQEPNRSLPLTTRTCPRRE